MDSMIRNVPVPVPLVGLLIGKKGANIKDINDRSGARCWVDNTKLVQGCKVVEIVGDLQAVNLAKQIIESQLGQFKMKNSNKTVGAGAEGGIPGMGSGTGRKGKKAKKGRNKQRNQEFVEPGRFERRGDEHDIYVSDEDNEEVKADNNKDKEERQRYSSSNVFDGAFGDSVDKDKEKIKKVNKEKLKEEEKRDQEELERCMNLREVSVWFRANLWGSKGSNCFNVGCATTSTSSTTGKVELLSLKSLAELGTRLFKLFKEQLETENYDTWKLAAGNDWRLLMRKANTSMEKNLCKAIANYFAAFHGARNSGDLVTARSLARNLLVSYNYMASRVRENCRMSIFCQAMDTFKLCVEMAVEGQDCAWMQPGGERRGVVDIFIELVEDWGVLLPALNVNIREMVQEGEKFVGRLDRWTKCEEERKVLGLARVRQGEALFNKAAMSMGEKNYADALYLFQEMYSIVEEAKRLLRFPDVEGQYSDLGEDELMLWQDLRLLITDVKIHTALAEALKEIYNADIIIKDAVEGYESLQLELVYNAVDKYRLAVTLARGEDIEIMCIAYTKIASVYLTVFKDGIHKSRAKEYLNDVMDFSKVMCRNLYMMDWYLEASTHLKNIQEENQKQEDELWQNQRKEHMNQLTEEVKLLEEHSSDDHREFLVFLFEKFPPKHRAESEWKHLLPAEQLEDSYDIWKKTMMKLVTIYHPDRVDKTVHSDKYHVLCEEITKELTNRYGRFK